MSSVQAISSLIKKEFMLEFRNKVSVSSMLLYVISTIFICYQSFKVLDNVQVWNALLWVIILFSAVNAVNKSFYAESKSQQMYFYLLTTPQNIILAKTIYNIILINVIAFISYVIYTVMLGMPGEADGISCQLLLVLFLGATGIAGILTLVSAIAAKTNNNLGLISILGFPIMVPVIMTVIKSGKNAADMLSFSVNAKYLVALGGLDLIIIALSFILFPYLWRE
jgi:heme exporter protein B